MMKSYTKYDLFFRIALINRTKTLPPPTIPITISISVNIIVTFTMTASQII